jgi:hypothetical protein
MSASSAKLDWKIELDQVVGELVQSTTQSLRREYDINRIRRRVGAPDAEALALELSRRVIGGQLSAVYRVISPETKNGIAEFKRFSDIPEEIYDETSDRTVHIEPYRDVELIYRGQPAALSPNK